METYICIGKCVPTPASLSRALPFSLSLFRPDLFHSSCTPPPPSAPRSSRSAPVPRSSRSYSRYSLSLSRSRDLSSSRTHPRSRHPAFSRGAAAAHRSPLFFPPWLLFFPQHAPEPFSDFYNLLLVAPHTTGRRRCRCRHRRRVSGAAHPEKPENRGKQKRPARRAAHPAGWCAWTARWRER